jgi:predicted dehydrogenase
MAKALIIGLGFGQAVYKPVLTQLGYEVITVDMDTSKGADFSNLDDAIRVHSKFDTVNICTPNFTHIKLARKIAAQSKIVFVEKPGVANSEAWKQLCIDYPQTRFMMVKNNQYRDTIKQFKTLADQSHTVRLVWNNKNRIPNPGSWFTTKDLAFGGVSRDLMPHMLSYYVALTDYTKGNKLYSNAVQRHELENIIDTDYGRVDHNGTYNVDDFCEFEFSNSGTRWILSANWKDDKADDVYISFDMKNSAAKFVLGLCPEEAYKAMIENAVDNLNNNDFWKDQLEQDLWIHKQIENL